MKFLRTLKNSLLIAADLFLSSLEIVLYLDKTRRSSLLHASPHECLNGTHKTVLKLSPNELAWRRASKITCSHLLVEYEGDVIVGLCGRPATWICRHCKTSLCARHAWSDRPGMINQNTEDS